LGLIFNGMSTTATAVNLVTTIFKLRAPGMSLNRLPLFCYAQLAAAGSALFLLPPLTLDLVLPAFGITTSIIPTFAKRKMLAAPLVALAELLVAFIGFGVWAHHMFATG